MTFDKSFRVTGKDIKADVIILGCTLPGIVAAHKLKAKFGNTMDIVVLDLAGTQKAVSKCNVAFQKEDKDKDTAKEEYDDSTAKQLLDNITRYYLSKFAREFKIPLPDSIIEPRLIKKTLNKVFQYENGSAVECNTDFHDFDYLSFLEKFELNQYFTLLDQSMRDLFLTLANTEVERKRLHYYDRTTMEKHICNALIFRTSRNIMRTTVRLICGAPATAVSVLFYLHQCYRTNSSRNHLDGDNTRVREKLLGYCRKRLANKLQQSIADITLTAKSIKEIRTCAHEQVILKTIKGDRNYVCNLLAMALRPDQLDSIQLEDQLLSENHAEITRSMTQGKAKKFLVQYEENFWSRQGYSGDILSIKGPIIWAMERPRLSTTGSLDKYAALVGYLIARDEKNDSKEAVIEQLVKIFGEEASLPVTYKETNVADVFIPRCGDYVALRRLTTEGCKYLEWGALDIFADGDVASALEAGNAAYLHLLSCLRPQAQTYDDLTMGEWPHTLHDSTYEKWISQLNIINGLRFVMFSTVLIVGVSILKSYWRR
ncbi:hypothetical protein K1T71_001607 [Dendrolimus kikuchii]|uniref:Uncharacterized protein n=1 Tax=Dendrolimus kikuchii TaxID=765133 RepID=A0ACC1DE74_9NEOP|nr:hypothetical protein K1T71_001607 [Dendrolimus kikuchii]